MADDEEHLEQTRKPVDRNKIEHVQWKFLNLRTRAGFSQNQIFGDITHPLVLITLPRMQMNIGILTGVDYWLENLMCQIPEIPMFSHSVGVLQRHGLFEEHKLPATEDHKKRTPTVIRELLMHIICFLKVPTKAKGYFYWLFKSKWDDQVKLYDLTSVFPKPTMDPNGNIKMDPNPIQTSVATLMYRIAKNMLFRRHQDDRSVSRLLTNCLELSKNPRFLISVHYLLAEMNISNELASLKPTCPLKFVYSDFEEKTNPLWSWSHFGEDDGIFEVLSTEVNDRFYFALNHNIKALEILCLAIKEEENAWENVLIRQNEGNDEEPTWDKLLKVDLAKKVLVVIVKLIQKFNNYGDLLNSIFQVERAQFCYDLVSRILPENDKTMDTLFCYISFLSGQCFYAYNVSTSGISLLDQSQNPDCARLVQLSIDYLKKLTNYPGLRMGGLRMGGLRMGSLRMDGRQQMPLVSFGGAEFFFKQALTMATENQWADDIRVISRYLGFNQFSLGCLLRVVPTMEESAECFFKADDPVNEALVRYEICFEIKEEKHEMFLSVEDRPFFTKCIGAYERALSSLARKEGTKLIANQVELELAEVSLKYAELLVKGCINEEQWTPMQLSSCQAARPPLKTVVEFFSSRQIDCWQKWATLCGAAGFVYRCLTAEEPQHSMKLKIKRESDEYYQIAFDHIFKIKHFYNAVELQTERLNLNVAWLNMLPSLKTTKLAKAQHLVHLVQIVDEIIMVLERDCIPESEIPKLVKPLLEQIQFLLLIIIGHIVSTKGKSHAMWVKILYCDALKASKLEDTMQYTTLIKIMKNFVKDSKGKF